MKSIALLMTASLLLSSCALKPQPKVQLGIELPQGKRSAVPSPHRVRRLTVAVMPFEDRTGAAIPVGDIAANIFTQGLLGSDRYKVLGETVSERSVKVESTVESSSNAGRSKEQVSVRTTEKRTDPIAWGKKVGAEAVVTGAVTIYRDRRLFILPPAKAAIEAKLIHVASREVLWSATYTRSYGWYRWLPSIIWPVGVILALTAPAADRHLEAACRQTAHRVLHLLDQRK
jgi:TolB-like protein